MRERSQTIIAKDANEFLEQSINITRRKKDENLRTVPNTNYSQRMNKARLEFDENKFDMCMDENELLEEINDINNYLHPDEEKTDPKILCRLLKEYLKKMSDNHCPIRATLKKYFQRTLSCECLDQLDLKDCLTNLVSSPSTTDTDFGLNSILTQNVVLEEDLIKVMFISLNRIERENVFKSFIGKTIEEKDDFEIRKKFLNLFNKTIKVEIFDTDIKFHKKETSRIYYKLSNAIMYIVDCQKPETLTYIQELHITIMKHTYSIFAIICINYDGKPKIKQFCEDNKIIFFPTDYSTFNDKNDQVMALFTVFVMKKKRKIVKKPKDDNNNNIGYNKVYKISGKDLKKLRKYSMK